MYVFLGVCLLCLDHTIKMSKKHLEIIRTTGRKIDFAPERSCIRSNKTSLSSEKFWLKHNKYGGEWFNACLHDSVMHANVLRLNHTCYLTVLGVIDKQFSSQLTELGR